MQLHPRKRALHLYSGPQHPACISNQFSAQGWDCGDIDTKVEPEIFSSNDLATDDLWLEINEAVETGQISAAHMGPECSTCSHARFNPPRIPRPIRSQKFPMGLPKAQLSQSEDLEVKTANYHYLQCISLGELLWKKGVPFSIEFPAKLGDYHVTLKDLPATISLLRRKGVRLIRLDQCTMECQSQKPTELICYGDGWPLEGPLCNHPWITTGKRKRDGTPILKPPHTSAATLSYAKKLGGKWKTSNLAAYPPSFCSFITNALVNSHQSLPQASNPPGAECPPATSSKPSGAELSPAPCSTPQRPE